MRANRTLRSCPTGTRASPAARGRRWAADATTKAGPPRRCARGAAGRAGATGVPPALGLPWGGLTRWGSPAPCLGTSSSRSGRRGPSSRGTAAGNMRSTVWTLTTISRLPRKSSKMATISVHLPAPPLPQAVAPATSQWVAVLAAVLAWSTARPSVFRPEMRRQPAIFCPRGCCQGQPLAAAVQCPTALDSHYWGWLGTGGPPRLLSL
mmetsp:Transcript_83763/g.232153  ORF Transcript_83763/g.232153 Transcript_83763/m.232153 type:complete len:208 (-) Transcript_83763:481-1104(-)